MLSRRQLQGSVSWRHVQVNGTSEYICVSLNPELCLRLSTFWINRTAGTVYFNACEIKLVLISAIVIRKIHQQNLVRSHTHFECPCEIDIGPLLNFAIDIRTSRTR